MKKTSGERFTDDEWGYGQTTAVLIWAPFLWSTVTESFGKLIEIAKTFSHPNAFTELWHKPAKPEQDPVELQQISDDSTTALSDDATTTSGSDSVLLEDVSPPPPSQLPSQPEIQQNYQEFLAQASGRELATQTSNLSQEDPEIISVDMASQFERDSIPPNDEQGHLVTSIRTSIDERENSSAGSSTTIEFPARASTWQQATRTLLPDLSLDGLRRRFTP